VLPGDLLSASIVLAAGEGPPPFLTSTAVLVVAAAVVGYLSVRAKVVPIVGFLVAGVLIGPTQLGLVSELETVEAAAEIGVIFLLFIIGIEFSLERLAALRTWIAVGGALQVGLTVLAVMGICAAFGVGWRDGLFTGFLVSLSSTAIVLKLLGDARETTTARGRLAVALLVFQDLAVVAMVLFVPLLAVSEDGGTSTGDLLVALLTAAGIVAAVLLVARRLLPPVLELVARTCSPEVFLLTVLAICFGTAYLTAVAGVSVSLGAFLAGLLVSESRLSSQALGEILPLQILFSAVFFVSVGMLLDVRFVLANLGVVLLGVLVVFLVKALTTWLAVTALRRTGGGLSAGTALGSALLLAQVGEFSFVLETEGRAAGLSPAGLGEDGSQTFIAASVLLLLATPALAGLGRRVEQRLEARHDVRRQADASAGRGGGTAAAAGEAGPGELPRQVLLSGWGPATRALARELRARGIDLTVTTLNPDGAAQAETDGHRVVMGDSTKSAVLEMAGLERTRLLVVAEDTHEQAVQIAGVVAGLARYQVPVLARPLGGTDVAELAAVGVRRVVDAEGASRHALTKAVLGALGEDAGPVPAVLLPDGGTGRRSTVDMSRVVVVEPSPRSPPASTSRRSRRSCRRPSAARSACARAPRGCTCGCAPRAGRSAAATPRPASMRAGTRPAPTTRSSPRWSRTRAGRTASRTA
jgi:CPA2 family monovalent cation:H+ antiporter-2